MKLIFFFTISFLLFDLGAADARCANADRYQHKHYLKDICPYYIAWTGIPFLAIKLIPSLCSAEVRERASGDLRLVFSTETGLSRIQRNRILSKLILFVGSKALIFDYCQEWKEVILGMSCTYLGRYFAKGTITPACFTDTFNPLFFLEMPYFLYNKMHTNNDNKEN